MGVQPVGGRDACSFHGKPCFPRLQQHAAEPPQQRSTEDPVLSLPRSIAFRVRVLAARARRHVWVW